MDTKAFARKIVVSSMRIGQKENSGGIKKAMNKNRKLASWILKTGEFTLSQALKQDKNAEKLLREFQDVDYGPLVVKKGSKYCAKAKIGHSVLIAYNDANKELAHEVERQCWRQGAHTMMSKNSVQRMRDSFLLQPNESLMELSSLGRAVASNTDYIINIDSVESEFWKEGIPPGKFKLKAPVSQKVSMIRDTKKVRWAYVGWPHKGIAKDLGIPAPELKRILDNSIKWSYKSETTRLIEGYYRALKGSEKIQIECDKGTDLTFSVKGRKFLKDDCVLSDEDIANNDIGMNIPCGEVFTAPVETSAEGRLYIPKNIILGYGMAYGIVLDFHKGEVVGYTAKKNKKHLDRMFRENTGDCRRIAELGIGCNKGAEFTNGYILVDEKILGTLHVAIGWNVGYGGKNKASMHLDFIKPMDRGMMYADGRLVMDRGRFVG